MVSSWPSGRAVSCATRPWQPGDPGRRGPRRHPRFRRPSHARAVGRGARAFEFEMRIGGASVYGDYGGRGGIVSTVSDTRAAPMPVLISRRAPGSTACWPTARTTVEAKTGYGLDTSTEIKQLGAIAHLQRLHPVDLVPTFLGARCRARPSTRARTDPFVDLIVDEMTPAVAAAWEDLQTAFPPGWPLFCDVFCEAGAFDLAQSRRMLEAGRAWGWG